MQTVQADGTNFAWLDHVEGGFTVPDLGYTSGYDNPYGAITIPGRCAEDPKVGILAARLPCSRLGALRVQVRLLVCIPGCSSSVKVYSRSPFLSKPCE